jgi:hypothetical protein
MAVEGSGPSSTEPNGEEEEQEGSPFRTFLRRVSERMASVVANPMLSVWDSARRDERRRRKEDY